MIKEEKLTAIVLVNYNGWEDTLECIESITTYINEKYLIWIVDNSSTDESQEKILSQFPEIIEKGCCFKEGDKIHIQFEEGNIYYLRTINKGFAAANNKVLKLLVENEFDGFFWILNNDTIVTQNSLNELMKSISNKVGVVGSCLLYEKDRDIIQAYGGRFNKFFGTGFHVLEGQKYNEVRFSNIKIDYPVGASMLVQSEFVKDVGLMNEDYFLYYEEYDWILRGIKRKWSFNMNNRSVVYHKEGKSIGTKSDSSISPFSEYWLLKNRIVFMKSYFRKYLFTMYVGFVLLLINRLRRFEFSKFLQAIKILLHS